MKGAGSTPEPGDAPVAWLSAIYPLLTETFVYREVEALRSQGLPVLTFAGRRPPAGKLSEQALPHLADTVYVLPVAPLPFVGRHLARLLRSPRRYLGTLWLVLTRRGDPLRVRLLALAHFAMAVHLAVELERRRVRHVHAHFSVHAATMALVLSRLLDLPFSFTAHNLLFSRPMLLPAKVRAARFVVAISECTRRRVLQAALPEDLSERVHVVHCGVDTRALAPRPEPPAEATPEVLFVAQLAERKGARHLVLACAELRRRGVSFRCRVVGEGPCRPELEALVAEHELADHVELRGALAQEELTDLWRAASVFALPCVVARDGDVDGIPVALMEAMALGIPVVSTPVSGIPELIEDGVTGRLVPPGDAEALASALGELLTDRGYARRLARAGRAHVEREFDLETCAGRLLSLLRATRTERSRDPATGPGRG